MAHIFCDQSSNGRRGKSKLVLFQLLVYASTVLRRRAVAYRLRKRAYRVKYRVKLSRQENTYLYCRVCTKKTYCNHKKTSPTSKKTKLWFPPFLKNISPSFLPKNRNHPSMCIKREKVTNKEVPIYITHNHPLSNTNTRFHFLFWKRENLSYLLFGWVCFGKSNSYFPSKGRWHPVTISRISVR